MLTLYRPGTGWLHRMPAGPKTLLLLAFSLAIFLLPPVWWAAAVATATSTIAYAVAGLSDKALGMRELGLQLFTLRWIIAVMIVSQLLFLGPEPAVANAARVTAGLLLAALLSLTTPVNSLLDSAERGLRPFRHIGIDPQRIALLLTITLSTVPVLARIAHEVRAAQKARGARANLRTFVVPFLVISLKHADQLGDALTARGVR
jgi:biotin transport system permease protein